MRNQFKFEGWIRGCRMGASALLIFTGDLWSANVALTPQGLTVAGGERLGRLTLEYPALTGDGGGERRKPVKVAVDGTRATLTYAGGARLELSAGAQGGVRVHASGLASNDKGISFSMTVPAALAGGARWSIDGSEPAYLPAVAGADAFLWRGDAKRFTLTDQGGKGLAVVIEHGYQQLQDNRVWNTPSFQWLSFSALPRSGSGEAWFTVHLLEPDAPLPPAEPSVSAPPVPVKPAAAESLVMTLSEKGIELGCGGMGSFTLAFPVLYIKGGEKKMAVESRIQGGVARLTYEGGGTISVSLAKDKIALTFDGMPSGVEHFASEMFIPSSYSEGGKWFTGDADGEFPKQKPAKPHLYQGHSRRFEFSHINNRRLSLALPEHTYVQIQDNREWGWNIFLANFKTPLPRDRKTFEIAVALDASAAQRVILVDRFGQTARRDFPGKLSDEAELKSDAAAEELYYAGFKVAARNRFGGLPGSGHRLGLKQSGFFHVETRTIAGRERWILVDPEGDAFFHLGVCTFGNGEDYTSIEKREEVFEWLPPRSGDFVGAWHPEKWWNPRAVSFYKANVVRKYAAPYDDETQLGRLVDRVRQIGFNSVGAFSGDSALFTARHLPRVSSLPLGEWTLGPSVPGLRGVFDPFDETVIAKMDALFADSVAKRAADPLIIGYFLANEQGFEDLPRAVPALPGKHPCKRALVDMLKQQYNGSITAFNTAWALDAETFEALADRGLPLTTQAAYTDMQRYTELFLERYYQRITATFRKYDPNHMLIGNRWQPGTANSETLCRVAGKYMDVISINYYACGIDESFIRRLYEWSGRKPQMWSEFYFTATQESNAGPSGNDLPTQRERGLAYRHYVEHSAALGFVVGIEWFTLLDQAVTGRFFEGLNGERANTGLFNVADRPYQAMFTEMAATHAVIYDVWLGDRAPYCFDHPRFIARAGAATRTVSAGRPTAPMVMDGQLTGWPGRPPERIGADRLAVGRESGGTEAAFKVCWDEKNLYLLANVTDSTPMRNTRQGAHLWSGDVLEIFIGSERPEQGGPLLFTDRQILLGAGTDNQCFVVNQSRQPVIESAVVADVEGRGYTLEAAIPWTALGVTPREDQSYLFDLAVGNSTDGQERSCQLVWNGKDRNSSDRSAWGRLTLVP